MSYNTSQLKLTDKHPNKKHKHLQKQNKKEKPSSTSSLSNLEQIGGIEKVHLSPDTQLFIGCKIGENITPERPWIFVEKLKIEEDIIAYKKASEFVFLEKKIKIYPEKKMLIGTYSYISDEKVLFYLCIDLRAKEEIMWLLKKRDDSILAGVLACINRKARPWISLGSEVEVLGNMNRNNRCLFVVELQPLYPFTKQQAKFKIRTPKEYKNGYVEMLPGRFPINIIMRKRIDKSTQSIEYKQNKKIQVILKAVADKSTQYSFKFPKIILLNPIGKIRNFTQTIYEEISSELVINSKINNFTNDYKDLVQKPISTRMLRPMEISSHQDIINCKNKKISSISWNSLISGVVAAAYVNQPSFYITTQDLSTPKIPYDCQTDQFLVLIWTYQNQLQPKLYLHAIREVTSLSFCPYNENILVGGCSNGQILVWDIANKLSIKEPRTGCSKEEYQVHMFIENLTSWIKKIPGEKHIFPVIISALSTSHLTPVSSIVWIPPSRYISRYGRYEDSLPDQKHMQFLTSSISGSKILVYDLIPDKKVDSQKKVKVSRLAKLPAGLRSNKSILTEMRYTFNPKYKMSITDPGNHQACHPIMKIIIRNDRYTYQCENPETIEATSETTNYKMLDLLYPFDRTMNLMCSTGCGTLQIVSWEGHNYDQGLRVNSERCKVNVFKVIHDGPVLVCEANPFFPDVLLTIGGTILAIWNASKSEKFQNPLLWRKAKCRYCSGMWSYIHPLAFVMIRTDTFYEYWNLTILSHYPITSFKHKGTLLMKLYSDSRKYHVRKKTFITTDDVGAFKVFTLPSWEKDGVESSDRIESLELLERMLEMKKYIATLKKKCVKVIENIPEKVEEPLQIVFENTPSIKTIVKPNQSYQEYKVQQWQLKEEIHMRNELLEKKHIRIQDFEERMKPVRKKIKIKEIQERKIRAVLKTGEEPIKKLLKSISATFLKVRRNIKVGYKDENRPIMKQNYKDSYNKLEKDVIRIIGTQPYKITFDWNLFLNRKRTQRILTRAVISAKIIGGVVLDASSDKRNTIYIDTS